MADPKVLKEWLDKADEEFEFAISVVEDSTFFAQICFHFHQAAEKYLKSVIIAYDLEFKKIHDLPILLKTCLARDKSLADLLEDCKFINRFYINTRYPVHWPTSYTKDDALRAKDAADHIRNEIKRALASFLSSS
jgi:HEPN domain-containing protein